MATLIQVARDIYPHDPSPTASTPSRSRATTRGRRGPGAQGADRGRHRRARPQGGPPAAIRGIGWEADRVALLEEIEDTPFFQTVRGGLVIGLYNQKDLWPLFGYEGESYSKGGYIAAASTTSSGSEEPPARRRRFLKARLGRKPWLRNTTSTTTASSSSSAPAPAAARSPTSSPRRAIDVVMLEAGRRASNMTSSSTTSGTASPSSPGSTTRTTSGDWRVAKDFPGLPAWIVKAVGGTTTHWAGASLRFQDHEFKARTTYGKVAGANLLDWPIDLGRARALLRQGRGQDGRDPHQRHRGPAGQQQLQGLRKPALRSSATRKCHTGRMAINSAERDDRMGCQQTGFCFQGCKWGAKWSTALHRDPEGRGDRQARGAAAVACRQDRARRRRQGDRRGLCRQGRQAAEPEGPPRLRRLQLHREPAPAAQLGLLEIPGRARQLLRPGRQELHAPHHRLGLRACSTSRCKCTAAPPWRASSATRPGTIRPAASSAATRWRRWRSACPSWPPSSTPAPGAASSPRRSTATIHGRHVDRRRGHAAGEQRA